MIAYHEVEHDILTPDLDELRIEPIADLHVGAESFREHQFREKVLEIQDSPNSLVILDGDLMNNSTKASVGDTYHERITPEEQVDKVIDLLYPIRDRIICSVRGNHEYRSIKDVCLDPAKYIARGLGVEDTYFGDAAFLVIPFGRKANQKRVVYTAFVAHGNGGGPTAGGKVNGLGKLGRVAFSDLVIGAHTHMPSTHRACTYVPDLRNKGLIRHETVCVNTGTYLDMEDYAIRKNLPPSAIGNPTILLSGREKRVRVLS